MQSPTYPDITGAILVGGKSRRMGSDKALLQMQGRPLFAEVLELFTARFGQVVLAGDRAERFSAYRISVMADRYPGSSLGGIHGALSAATTGQVFIAPCDLPFPSPQLLDRICSLAGRYDAIVPVSNQGIEPLYALYARSCLQPAQQLLEQGCFRIIDLLDRVQTHYIQIAEQTDLTDPDRSFLNINTPLDFERLSKPQT